MAEHIEPQIINLGELLRVGALRAELADLKAELEQQRTRAEGAEQDLRDYTAHVAQSRNEDRSKLAAARAHLAGVDWGELQALDVDLRRMEDPADSDFASLIAAAREVLS